MNSVEMLHKRGRRRIVNSQRADYNLGTMREKYKQLFVIWGLIIITFTVFWQVREFKFVDYDDDKYVSENEHILSGLTVENVVWAFTSPHYFMWHPITSLSHMLDCELFGLKPGWHHLTNLAVHIANTVLLFEILRRMTTRLWPSAFVAAVFALHPLNVESVVWVCERKNVLSVFFWLLTIAAYIRYAKRLRTSDYLLVILVFSLALMSKPTAVTLPFALLLLDYWPLNRFQRPGQNTNERMVQLVKEKIPLILLSAVLCIITVSTQKSGDALKFNENFPFSVRLANALVSYVSYIGKMIYPARLAVFYPHPGYSLPLWKPVVAFMVLAAVSAAAIRFGYRRPYFPVGWFWFLGTLVPVIGLVQAGDQAMADRYAYLTLIGLFIIVAWSICDLTAGWMHRNIALGLLSIAIILVLSVCTWFQAGYWRDSMSLFERAVQVTNGNYIAYNGRGLAYYDKGQYDLAISDYAKALAINPKYAAVYNNLGTIYAQIKGQYDTAISCYDKAIELRPSNYKAYLNRGVAYKGKGQLDLAISDYNKAIEINPRCVDAYNNRGNAYKSKGLLDQAIADYNRAINISPGIARFYYNRGIAYGSKGAYGLAISDFNKAIEINPRESEAYINKAGACEKAGRVKEAVEAYKIFVQLAPSQQYAPHIEHAKQRIRQLER